MKHIMGTIAGLAALAAIGKINNIVIRTNTIKGMQYKVNEMHKNGFIDDSEKDRLLAGMDSAPDWDTLRQFNSDMIDPIYREYSCKIYSDIVNR